MTFILHHDHMIVAGKPLQEVLQNNPLREGVNPWNGAQALVFLPNTITSVAVSFYRDKRIHEDGFYCWHEDKEGLEADDFHFLYQSDYEGELVHKLANSFCLDVNAPIWYPWPGEIPHVHVCWHCGKWYEEGSAKDDTFCSDTCYNAH